MTRSVGMQPPPAVPSLKSFPPSIGSAFETAFGPDGVQQRPTAKQWIALLSELEQGLRVCSSSALHHYPQSASECPWCKMERLLGIELFTTPAPNFTTPSAANAAAASGDLTALWRAIEAIQPPPNGPFTPSLHTPTLEPSAEAKAARNSKWKRQGLGTALLVVAIAIAVGFPSFWIAWLFVGALGFGQLFNTASAGGESIRKARDVELRWLQALDDWQKRCEGSEFLSVKASLAAVKSELEAIPAEVQRRTRAFEGNRRAQQLKLFLERFQIRRYKISGIGPSKLATLTSYGIDTAAEVIANRVLAVPGFGPVNSGPLLEWRRQLETRFVYNANPTPVDKAAEAAIKAELAQKSAELRRRLAIGAGELSNVAAAARQKSTTVDPTLQRLHEARTQALTDLKFLGLTLPPVRRPTPVAPLPTYHRPTYAQPHGKPRTNSVSCPMCGSPMIARTARRGRAPGRRFYGCSRFPSCRGTRPYP